ncbi:MAG: FtsX-like permease family protein [Actinomycetaceae bacterium]|nr:FtsX-like permease family protein [Actinomycetaceae bacterium]
MIRLAWRSLRANLGRFIATLIAVALGIGFLSGTLALKDVLAQNFQQITATHFHNPVFITGTKKSSDNANTLSVFSPVPADLAKTAKKVDGVKDAIPDFSSTGVLLKPDGTVLKTGSGTVVVTYMRTSAPVSGTAPKKSNEIGLTEQTMKTFGLKLGDKLKLVVAGEVLDVTVVATFKSDFQFFQLVLMGEDATKQLFGSSGLTSQIGINLKKGTDINTTIVALNKALPAKAQAISKATLVKANNETIEKNIGFINTFLLVFVAIALFIGAFIIANTFHMSVLSRTKEFALLRAVGVSASQVFGQIGIEALLIGFIGSVLGIGLGNALLWAITALLQHLNLPLRTVTMAPNVWTTALVVGTVVTVLGALFPARRAARTAPVEAMRNATGAGEKPLYLRGVLGVIIAIGAVACLVSALQYEGGAQNALLGVGSACAVIATLVLLPILALALAWVLQWPLRIFRPEGRLGYRNILRSPRRLANTAGALTIGVALVAAGSMMASSLNVSTAGELAKELKADLLVTPFRNTQPLPLGPGTAKKISDLPEVARIDTGIRFTSTEIARGSKKATPEIISVGDTKSLRDNVKLKIWAGTDSLNPGEVICFSPKKKPNCKLGEKITFTGPLKSRTATISGIADTSAVINSSMLANRTDIKAVGMPYEMQLFSFVHLEKGASSSAAKSKIAKILKPTYSFEVQNGKDLESQIVTQINQAMAVLYGLLALSIFIAITGIINTLTLSVSERIREIGLLRAVGMGRFKIAKLITIESILTTVIGAIMGILLGTTLGWVLLKTLRDQGITTIAIPWTQLCYLTLGAIFVGILAAAIPAGKAARKPILDAIAHD